MGKKYVDLLETYQTNNHKHGQRQLLDHLSGTYNMLMGWKVADDVCLAGLFHSIYGTEFHQQSATGLEQRNSIKTVIGERAEFLAYVFCVCKRFEIFSNLDKDTFSVKERSSENLIKLNRGDLLDLLTLEAANLIEQTDFFESISPSAGNKYIQVYSQAKEDLPVVVSNAVQSFFNKLHPNKLVRPAMYGRVDELCKLIAKGEPVNDSQSDKRSATALMYSVVYNQYDSVKILLENGADPNIPDKYGNLPKEVAEKNGRKDIVLLLQ